MSFKILTSCVTGIDTFIQDPQAILSNVKEETVAIFINNTPTFYVISPKRLEQLLNFEARFIQKINDQVLDDQFYKKNIIPPLGIPIGKFPMYEGWQPDKNFCQMASLWGISITQPVQQEELASFIAYWQAEGKIFHHIQWQQKLARSIQISRFRKEKYSKCNMNIMSEINNQIPKGFRG